MVIGGTNHDFDDEPRHGDRYQLWRSLLICLPTEFRSDRRYVLLVHSLTSIDSRRHVNAGETFAG